MGFTGTAQQQKDADALNHLGLFLGTGKGYELDAELNRNQSVMLLVRMLGKLTEAETGDYAHPFNDVPKWASKVVAYQSGKHRSSLAAGRYPLHAESARAEPRSQSL